jgi:small GTP-binding protein
MAAAATKTFKIVIIGDGSVGKTCFFISKIYKTFPCQYVPTVFDNYVTKIFRNGEIYELALWDTAGWMFCWYSGITLGQDISDLLTLLSFIYFFI